MPDITRPELHPKPALQASRVPGKPVLAKLPWAGHWPVLGSHHPTEKGVSMATRPLQPSSSPTSLKGLVGGEGGGGGQ